MTLREMIAMTVRTFLPRRVQQERPVQYAARWVPAGGLEDLRAVAKMAGGEVAEVTFASGRQVLLAWWPGAPGEPDYIEVDSGEWLVFSGSGKFLYCLTDNDMTHYDDVTEVPGE